LSDIKCIVIKDEPLAVKVLTDYIAEISFIKLTAGFKDAILATKWLRINSVSLILPDIHLPKLKGMAFLKPFLTHPLSLSPRLITNMQ
jgi:two-component system, LytTR family, response regulator